MLLRSKFNLLVAIIAFNLVLFFCFILLPAYGAEYESAAVLYLAAPGRDTELRFSLVFLYFNYFFWHGKYPVYIFHGTDHHVDLSWLSELMDIRFIPLKHWESEPQNLKVPKIYKGFSVDYRRMCYFWAYGLYQYEEIRSLNKYMRLDTDSFILTPMLSDPLAECKWYCYRLASKDAYFTTEGLYDRVKEFALRKGYDLSQLKQFELDGEYNLEIYYNNFEVSRVDTWNSTEYQEIFDAVKDGIFTKRWGDAPIKTLALQLLRSKDKENVHDVQLLSDFSYVHQSLFLCVRDIIILLILLTFSGVIMWRRLFFDFYRNISKKSIALSRLCICNDI